MFNFQTIRLLLMPLFGAALFAFSSASTAATAVAITVTRDANTDAAPLVGTDFVRRQIYHSPQTPGWTSWVGAWFMPDGSMMVSFVQATGPLAERHAERDYGGLKIDVIYLRSTDAGKVWEKTAESPVDFATPRDAGRGTHANNGGPTLALKDGSILRRVYGYDYKAFPDMPGTSFLQRSPDLGKSWTPMPTSGDGGRTWSDPDPRLQEFLLAPSTYTVQPTRARRLRDGRLLIGGGVWNGRNTQKAASEPLLMVSDDEAASWTRVDLSADAASGTRWGKLDEWDFAEIPDGNLLVVARTADRGNRNVGVLRKTGDTWRLASFRPSAIPHSGHPELLATAEGPILSIATTGILQTTDAGQSWSPLAFPGVADNLRAKEQPATVSTRYYPRSLQAPDGRIFVFSHRGSDNAYGQVDQSIFMDTFRLAKP